MNALARNPEALFGVLIALEAGMPAKRLAARLGQAEAALISAAESARAGEVPRQPAWDGERMASEAVRLGPLPSLRREVLAPRWMRRAARHLAQHGAMPLGTFREIVDTESESAANWLKQLTHQLRPLGIRLKAEGSGETAQLVLDAESRGLLEALIAADWRVPA